jgi:hypothetical protein
VGDGLKLRLRREKAEEVNITKVYITNGEISHSILKWRYTRKNEMLSLVESQDNNHAIEHIANCFLTCGARDRSEYRITM